MINKEEIPEASEVNAIVEDGQCEVVPFMRYENDMPFGTDGALDPTLFIGRV